MKKPLGLTIIWITFAVFIVLFLLNFILKGNPEPTSRMWLILDACVLVLSIFLLIKTKLPTEKQILISLMFGLVVFVALQGFSISSAIGFLCTFLCSLAVFSIFNKYISGSIKLFKSLNVKSINISVIIGLCVGIILGIINLFMNNGELHLKINISYFLTALNPAIYEEICFRTFMYAFCLYLLNGELNTKFEKFTCYFLMVIPHAMIHTPDIFIKYGVVSGIISTLMLAALFGLPFAILQRKRDLTSAMIAHGVVDVIRFSFLGLPSTG